MCRNINKAQADHIASSVPYVKIRSLLLKFKTFMKEWDPETWDGDNV